MSTVTTSAAGTAPPASNTLTRTVKRAGRRHRLGSFALRWAVLAALLGIWQLAAQSATSAYFPAPSQIFSRFAELWLPGESGIVTESLRADVLPSIGRMLLGLLLAVVVGVLLGVAIGLSRNLGDYVDPLIQFARAIPPPAIIPIFLVLFDPGTLMRVLLIAFGAVWPILLNTIEGVRSIDPIKYETSTVFRIGLRDRLLRIVLPGASQKVLAGVRTSLALALILMVISEMVASTGGIGYLIVQSQRTFMYLDMWAGILLLGALGYLLNLLLNVVEHRLLAWHRAGTRETA